ncbi:MAG TPA: hypothetical protein VJ842_13135 [Pyrinomonadaceae bacterium]|nr:hypothetical protein [Pyrinomonadaceae bacterium]
MLPQCLQFVFTLTFCFQVTAQNYHVDNRALYVEDLSAPVAQDRSATYLDLLRELFPGVDETGGERFVLKRAARLRNLEHPREVVVMEGAIEISIVQSLWFADEGEEHLALIVNARHEPADGESDEVNVLAVFRVQSQPHLVDAALIDFDRFIGFWDESPLLPVRQGETAFWIRATHHNSNEGFHSYFLTELLGNRLRLALRESFGLMDVKLCGSETSETLKIGHERGQFAGYRVFDLHVRTETNPTERCEGERAVKRRVVVRTHRLRWDARLNKYRSITLKAMRAGLRRQT